MVSRESGLKISLLPIGMVDVSYICERRVGKTSRIPSGWEEAVQPGREGGIRK